MKPTASSSSSASQYDARTIALHWITAALVVALWALGQTIDWFPRGTPRAGARSVHITLGVLLALVLVVRVSWRVSAGTRLPVPDGWLGTAARAGHGLLYLLLIAAVLAGLANVWVHGDNVFGLLQVPAFDPGNRALQHQVGEIHSWLADALFVLAGLHAAAALMHHYVLKDGVLRRMLPRLAPPR
ncbi:MAG: cytochrome b [Burkholderiales bacterium]|nr:cytochrome b/b6 domain-containing protein [Burkholderiales bacterium]MDE1927749.1 cytochrome b [Burkholderiales bacterium]MDE2159143.1 cytochrome b [Burkholderiales bacterium]MDE2504799.1 cytochrome b [Burkholderiales bacterium]